MKFKNTEISEDDKPDREQFQAYVDIQTLGITNMFDINCVTMLSGYILSEKNIFYIYRHYNELSKEYNIGV